MGENGAGSANGSHLRAVIAPPAKIGELAEACVRFVERAIGVKLDYEPETLSVLDHYLETARNDGKQRPEALAIVAHAAGVYLGEVLRRRYPSWWRAEGDDPTYYRVELEEVFLAVSPVQLVAEALVRPGAPEIRAEGEEEAADEVESPILADETGGVGIEIDEDDREAIKARLADLPQVSDEEFHAPSTRLEVIDITVEAIRARRIASGSPASLLTPRDYDSD